MRTRFYKNEKLESRNSEFLKKQKTRISEIFKKLEKTRIANQGLWYHKNLSFWLELLEQALSNSSEKLVYVITYW